MYQIFCKPIKCQRFSRHQTSKFQTRGRAIDFGYRIDLNDSGIQRAMPKELSENKDRSISDGLPDMRELNSATPRYFFSSCPARCKPMAMCERRASRTNPFSE